MIGLQKYKIGNGFTTCDLSSGHIITMTSLVTPTVQHALDTFSRFFISGGEKEASTAASVLLHILIQRCDIYIKENIYVLH